MGNRPLYSVGDRVRIKDLARLKDEFGDHIQVKSGWLDIFDEYAGQWYTVKEVCEFTGGGLHYSYRLDGASNWWFSEEVFDDSCDQCLAISFEEAMGM